MEKRWIEVFSSGDVWELKEEDGKLFGFKTENDASDYGEDELANNGVSTFEERARMMGLEAVRVSDDQDEMEKEIGRTEKTAIVEAYLLGHGAGLVRLKYEVAKMSIDMTGTMEQEYKVLLRVVRGYSPTLEYYKDGDDGYNNHDRFWFEFPMFFYRDMPSGEDIEEDEEDYLVTDTEGREQKIDKNDLIGWLIYDLTERNHGKFNDTWKEFLEELYNWIVEVKEVD